MESSFERQQRSESQDPRLRTLNVLSPSQATPSANPIVPEATIQFKHAHSNNRGGPSASGMDENLDLPPLNQRQTLRSLQWRFKHSERQNAHLEKQLDSLLQEPKEDQLLHREPQPQFTSTPRLGERSQSQREPQGLQEQQQQQRAQGQELQQQQPQEPQQQNTQRFQHVPEQQQKQEGMWTELDKQDSRSMTELQVRDINHLLKEMSLLDLDRSDPPEFKDESNPTGEEIQALLLFYKDKLRKCCHLKATVHIRFTRIEDSIRKLATFDRTFLEKACKQLQERKEHTMILLGNEMNGLRNDIESLTEILVYMTDFDKTREEEARLELVSKSRTTIRWNPAIPEHNCLHDIFGFEDIPVIMGTDDINYEGLALRDFEGAPSLDLEVSDFATESQLIDNLVDNVSTFVILFESFYREKLRILFEHLAWRYTLQALHVQHDVDVQLRYLGHIKKIPKTVRSWSQAKSALLKAIGLDMLRPHLIRKILLMTPDPKEPFTNFSARISPLLDAADISDTGSSLLIMSIVNLLSDYGVQIVLNEYGSFDAIPSLAGFLELLNTTPNVLGEPRTDRTHLFLLRYGGSKGASIVRKAIQTREAAPAIQKQEVAPAVQTREAAPAIQTREAAPAMQTREAAPAIQTREAVSALQTRAIREYLDKDFRDFNNRKSSNSTNPSPVSSPTVEVDNNPSLRQQKRPHFSNDADNESPVGNSSQHHGSYDDYSDHDTGYSRNYSPPQSLTRNSNKKSRHNTNTNSNSLTTFNNSRSRKKGVRDPCTYTAKCRNMPYKHEASECYIMLADMRASPSDVKERSFSP